MSVDCHSAEEEFSQLLRNIRSLCQSSGCNIATDANVYMHRYANLTCRRLFNPYPANV